MPIEGSIKADGESFKKTTRNIYYDVKIFQQVVPECLMEVSFQAIFGSRKNLKGKYKRNKVKRKNGTKDYNVNVNKK